MNPIYAWALSFIMSAAPVDRPHFIPEAKESVEEGTARRESIARDVVDVVFEDPAPPLFGGPNGRIREIPLILSIMQFESGFRRDIDYGLGKLSRGDHGKSRCLMQVMVGDGRTRPWNRTRHRFATDAEVRLWHRLHPADGEPDDAVVILGETVDEIEEGWTGNELEQDRRKCIISGLRIIRGSYGATRGMPPLDRLRVYASGSTEGGAEESAHRIGRAVRWYGRHPAPMTDAEYTEYLNQHEDEPDPDDMPAKDTLTSVPEWLLHQQKPWRRLFVAGD